MADFAGEAASAEARAVADWAAGSRDNGGLPYVIIDKVAARVFVFGADNRLRGATPALLGSGIGDDSANDIGQRRLAAISPAERTTPAGRFQASLGHDFDQDILWVDYAISLSLHRVINGNPKDRRLAHARRQPHLLRLHQRSSDFLRYHRSTNIRRYSGHRLYPS